jgi:mono/diheme cytochrome c family protein
MRTRFFYCFLTLGILAAGLSARGEEKAPADPNAPISYFRDVLPIFRKNNCTGCHQPAKKGGEYVMTDFEALLKGGETGEAAIVPGKPADSNLMAQITPKDGKADMPKDGPPLTAEQIALVAKWIEQGAKDDTPMSNRPQYDAEHLPVYLAAPVLRSLEYSPDGTLIAVAGYHEVLLHKADGSGIAARLVGQ